MDERLTRDASVVQAFAPELVPLDREDTFAESRRANCGVIAARTCPDHEDIDLTDHRRAKGRADHILLVSAATARGVPGAAEVNALFETDEKQCGVLQGIPHVLDECGADVTVNHPVIERTREVHHVADHDLIVPNLGALLVLVDDRDGDLGPVDDRRRENSTLLPQGGDCERGAEHVLECQAFFARGRRQSLEFLREAPQVFLVRVMDDRDRQAFVRRGRDPDVVVFLQHNLAVFVIDGRVQGREFLQRPEDRLDEEREEGELQPLSLRGLLQMVPQVDELGHVHFFDVREMGRGRVRLRHLLKDPLAKAMDRDSFLAATRVCERVWTVTLSVITSTTGSFSRIGSPSLTNHLTTSPSWTPSPISGSLNSRAICLLALDIRRKTAIDLTFCTVGACAVPPRGESFYGHRSMPCRGGVGTWRSGTDRWA